MLTLHISYFRASPPHPFWNPLSFLGLYLPGAWTEAEKAGVARTAAWAKDGRAYFLEHSTRPQTIGYSLADSPVGLLAWIYEKLIEWTDEYPFTDDEVLTWISAYWFSRAGPAASLRIYYEVEHDGGFRAGPNPKIPMGVAYFPKEIINLPRAYADLLGYCGKLILMCFVGGCAVKATSCSAASMPRAGILPRSSSPRSLREL